MSPLRPLLAGMMVILVALAILWVAGYANKPDPFRLYQPDELFFIQFFAVSLGGAGFVSIVRGLERALAKNLPRRTLPRVFPKLKLRNFLERASRQPITCDGQSECVFGVVDLRAHDVGQHFHDYSPVAAKGLANRLDKTEPYSRSREPVGQNDERLRGALRPVLRKRESDKAGVGESVARRVGPTRRMDGIRGSGQRHALHGYGLRD